MRELQEAFEARAKKSNKIEQIKALKTPLSVYERLEEIASSPLGALSSEDSGFFLKCFGLFLKKDNTFMLRIRIPAGQLTPAQAIKLGEVAQKYGNDYIDITTRQQFEFRYLALSDIAVVLKELESVGITTFQTGVDNFRNIVTSAFDGLGEGCLIETKPLIDELQSIFLKQEEWIGVLPRKFNTAILGSTMNDCNIYGHDCCFVLAKKGEKLGFNLYLGGKVGVQAQDSGLFVQPSEVKALFLAIIELFKTYGFRDNRNKNRLHFLLEAVGMERFVQAIEQTTQTIYARSGKILATNEYRLDNAMLKLGEDAYAYHLNIPSGIFKGSDLIEVGKLAQTHDAKIRLSVEQSLYIVTTTPTDILQSALFQRYSTYQNIYFNHQIACAGEATCAFGVIPNKSDAIEMASFLAKEVPMHEAKVRMYWSACVKGCGIHGIADIGFEGCKAKDSEGKSCYGVHILMGGKATKKAQEARVIYKSVPLSDAKEIVKKIMILYKNERQEKESFESFYERSLEGLSQEEIQKRVG